jgi:hypothetical protein
MTSNASLPYLNGRPSSVAGRSEFLSDDASTIGGEKDVGIIPNGIAPDTASTRAVRNVRGVSDVVTTNEAGRFSTETSSLRPGLSVDEPRNSTFCRPDMPDREVFKTADEQL